MPNFRITSQVNVIFDIVTQGLHDSYEDWLVGGRFGRPPAPVLILDADQGIDTMLHTYEQFKVRAGAYLLYKNGMIFIKKC